MEKFLVSARKYRPQHFSTVVGQEHITTTLKNAISSNQLAHAFLFCGPRGVGKTTCARILAKTINCTNRTAESEACDACTSCKSFNDGVSLNIHELDAASNNSVEDIRALVEQVRFAPQAGDYKVYIIDEVHMLSSAAFNAFLKTLEEPPSYAKFILATTEKHKILPTILSRCQIFDFKRITSNDTVQHLEEICSKENVRAEKAALQIIAQKSEGCMRDALSIMDKIVSFTGGELHYKNTLEHLNILDEEYFFKFLESFTSSNLPDALLLFDEINKKGFEGDTLIQGMSEFLRNLLVSKDEKTGLLLESIENFRKKYITTAKNIEANWVVSALNLVSDAGIEYRQARNKKLCVELLLIKLCFINQALEAHVAASGSSFKKKQDNYVGIKLKKLNSLVSLIKEPIKEIQPAHSITIEVPAAATQKKVDDNVASEQKKLLDFNKLAKIRQEITERKNKVETKEVKILTKELLETLWQEAVTHVVINGEQQLTKTVLQSVALQLVTENEFEVTVQSNINEKMVEEVRKDITEYIKKATNNRDILFRLKVVHDDDAIRKLDEEYIPKKKQYENIAEKYPNVKLLKENLRLDIDY